MAAHTGSLHNAYFNVRLKKKVACLQQKFHKQIKAEHAHVVKKREKKVAQSEEFVGWSRTSVCGLSCSGALTINWLSERPAPEDYYQPSSPMIITTIQNELWDGLYYSLSG